MPGPARPSWTAVYERLPILLDKFARFCPALARSAQFWPIQAQSCRAVPDCGQFLRDSKFVNVYHYSTYVFSLKRREIFERGGAAASEPHGPERVEGRLRRSGQRRRSSNRSRFPLSFDHVKFRSRRSSGNLIRTRSPGSHFVLRPGLSIKRRCAADFF